MNPASTHAGSVEEITPIGGQREEMKHQMTSYGRPIPNLPSGDLVENRDDYHRICVPLFKASITGDWEAVQKILSQHPCLNLLGFGITENYDTALHIAASANSTAAVKNLVKKLVDTMSKEQLELQNKNFNTALCLAVMAGNVLTVEIMAQKNPNLLGIPGSQGRMPLHMASILHGKDAMVRFLYRNSNKMMGDIWTDQNRGWILEACVEADIFDISLEILINHPELPVHGIVLGILARKWYAIRAIKPSVFWRVIHQTIGLNISPSEENDNARKLLQTIWKKILKMPKDTIDGILRGPADATIENNGNQKPKYSRGILFIAAKVGNIEFLVELIREYPDLMWNTNDKNQTIFHVAVANRHEDIYNLMIEIGSMKAIITPLIDNEGNNMLHLAGKMPTVNGFHDHSGALEIAREFLWFEEVESILPVSYQKTKNKVGLTPRELFIKEHKNLFSNSEKLLKDTANQCIVAAALIITIAFATAYTVPGGYDQENGIPIFIHNRSFIVFAISDAISLAFSCISILIFLSIFVSRCTERDVFFSLYSKLLCGLALLFFSISAMLVGFSVSFFVLYRHKLIWVPIIIAVLISIPIILFIRFPYDLLLDVYRSLSTKYLFRPKQPLLYYKNPKF